MTKLTSGNQSGNNINGRSTENDPLRGMQGSDVGGDALTSATMNIGMGGNYIFNNIYARGSNHDQSFNSKFITSPKQHSVTEVPGVRALTPSKEADLSTLINGLKMRN